MNNTKRKRLKTAITLIEQANDIISDVAENEQDCLDNMPENLQMSDRYETMENCVSSLEDVVSQLDNAVEGIEGVI